ncbi:unnamed protein product [Caenorhabditis auriculariae]|uniref:Sjoegren syndrome/scleroderma autoantigen 1 n=1 Tax=Caenorhabditis auriculariae TaxID=2777116 RepID=A0A8S1GVF0_9PELO|nr:unnamed protein product [Caenorhabditis auriculariae]
MGHKKFGHTSESQVTNPETAEFQTYSRMNREAAERDTMYDEDDLNDRVARIATRDRASEKMGQLLLRGFTMLDASCDTCHTVLMEKGGVRLCVKCEMDRETSGGSRIVSEVPLDVGSSKNPVAIPKQTVRIEARVTDAPKDWATAVEVEDPPVEPRRLNYQALRASTSRSQPRTAHQSIAAKPPKVLEIAEQATEVLSRKMQKVLADLEASDSNSEVIELASVLNSLVFTLTCIESLKKPSQ